MSQRSLYWTALGLQLEVPPTHTREPRSTPGHGNHHINTTTSTQDNKQRTGRRELDQVEAWSSHFKHMAATKYSCTAFNLIRDSVMPARAPSPSSSLDRARSFRSPFAPGVFLTLIAVLGVVSHVFQVRVVRTGESNYNRAHSPKSDAFLR
jgi:hypothetical protein